MERKKLESIIKEIEDHGKESLVKLYEDDIPSYSVVKTLLTKDGFPMICGFMYREPYIKKIGFSIHTKEEFNNLVHIIGDNVTVEVGSGSGYLLTKLKSECKNISGVDNYSTKYWNSFYKDGSPNSFKENENVVNDDAVNYLKKKSIHTDIVLMSWPDYSSDFAFEVSGVMKIGSLLLYKGESYGGCTANDNFFTYMDTNFEMINELTESLNDYSIQMDGLHDYWTVYKKVR